MYLHYEYTCKNIKQKYPTEPGLLVRVMGVFTLFL